MSPLRPPRGELALAHSPACNALGMRCRSPRMRPATARRGLECTLDACVAGVCVNAVAAGTTCSNGGTCDGAGQCVAGVCDADATCAPGLTCVVGICVAIL